MIELEVCATSVASCIAAEKGGAHRIELCAGLADGGITPSPGFVRQALTKCSLPIFPIIRPRGGDFLYDDDEIEEMECDIRTFGKMGVAGFVFGILTPDGEPDLEANARMLKAANGRPCTFHRAFDMVLDPMDALEKVVRLGFARILTSGGRNSALEGVHLLRELTLAARERIIIMAGAGIRPDNALEVVQKSGVTALHGTLQSPLDSRMLYRNPAVSMGGGNDSEEYLLRVTDKDKVKSLLAQFR